MEKRWSRRLDSGVREIHPFRNWRCRVWIGLYGVWCWEARRFGRFQLHVSGECGRLDHAKKIAVAAAAAIRGPK